MAKNRSVLGLSLMFLASITFFTAGFEHLGVAGLFMTLTATAFVFSRKPARQVVRVKRRKH